jgi:glycosyltransferase involved in cell wall biosynthesis
MMIGSRIYVVMAAYQEVQVIAQVVAGVVRAGFLAVVVDDGSSDGTGEAAASAGATIIRHPINHGQGAALQTGIDWALRQHADIIVTFDADGQHRIADVERLIAALHAHGADFALGSRFLGASINQPLSRRILLRAATVFTRLTTGLSLSDTHNGLRAMTQRGARAINLRQNRMAHASEILHQIADSGFKFVEVPVTIEYSAYSLTKGQTVGDALVILTDLFARRLHS